jgi:PBSX family phage portal protein
MDEQSEEVEIDVSAGTIIDREGDYPDPFTMPIEKAKQIHGISLANRRKIQRLEKKYTGHGTSESKQVESAFFSAYDQWDLVTPPNNLDYLAALYDVSSAHHAAVNAKMVNIVGLGYEFVETPETTEKITDAKSEKTLSRIRRTVAQTKIDVDKYLNTINAEDSFLEVLKKVWIDYEATGNGYIEVGRTAGGQIGYIGHIPSTTIRVRRVRDGYVQVIGRNATFFRNYGDRKTSNPLGTDSKPNELIHVKKYTPTNSFYGSPDILSAKYAVAGEEFANRYNLDYFEYKAVPRYVIISRGVKLSDAAEKTVHEFFLTNLKGKHHRSLYIPIPPSAKEQKIDFEIKPVEAGKQDSSFNNYHDQNVADILMVHRTPASKVGVTDGSGLAAARDSDKMFKEQVTRPEQEKIEFPLNKIVDELTDIVDIKMIELTLTDEDTQSQIAERYVRMQILTPNEARRRFLKMGPVEGGDKMVNLKAQEANEQVAQATGSRTRDQDRSAQATDSKGEGRATQGSGRSTQ